MRVSVIIPTFIGGALLERCLAALALQTRLPDEVVVVVSNPEDTTVSDALRWPFPLRVRRMTRRAHYGAAVNAGMGAAGGDELIILNDDTRPRPQFLAALVAARQAGGLAIYQPRILLMASPERIDNVGHGLFFDGFNWARGREALDGAPYDADGTVGAVSGAAFLLPRAVLDAIGPFDTSLEAFGEDVDLSLRAVRQGFVLRYVPEARIEHALGSSYGRYGARKVYLVERNRVRVAVRSLPASALATLPLWTVLRWAGLTAAAASGRGWGARLGPAAQAAVLLGAADGLRFLPDALRKRRQDAAHWSRGELAMWGHLLQERVRARDLFRGQP